MRARSWAGLLRRRRSAQPVRQVVIWSRTGCHLCDRMQEVVAEVAAERSLPPVEVQVRDLDRAGERDPHLLARYTDLVPVLLVDGAEVAHWEVDPAVLRMALRKGNDDAQ